MGFPEISDIARNFAVMIRVEGPDPKGLKMRNHAFHLYKSGKTTLSASGMILPDLFSVFPAAEPTAGDSHRQWFPGSAVVVTDASVVQPFLSVEHRGEMSQEKPELIPGVRIDVMTEGKKVVASDNKGSEEEGPQSFSAQILAMVEVPVSSIALQSLIQASSSSLEQWEVGWSLALYSDGPQPLVDDTKARRLKHVFEEGSSNANFTGRLTTKIALLGVSSTMSKDLPNLNISPLVERGDRLLAMGSPFGVLSSMHFFNSISVGSVANCYPGVSAKKSLLMADIRCLPGMEGGPVFGEHGRLIGILARPLRQKSSGVEIQLVIPWEAIATACRDFLQESPRKVGSGKLRVAGRSSQFDISNNDRSPLHNHVHSSSGLAITSPIQKATASVCLVTIDDGAWASGVLLNKAGLILTNAHLLEPWRFKRANTNGEANKPKSEVSLTPWDKSLQSEQEGNCDSLSSDSLLPTGGKTTASVLDDSKGYKLDWTTIRRSIRVRFDHVDPWFWCTARVVYVSKGLLDVALLQLEFVPDKLCPIVMDFRCPSPGSKVHVIGHGLFGPRCDLSASVCEGVVAKVVQAKRSLPSRTSKQDNVLGRFPAMLETTAAVHPGGSGGAVVNSDGHMIGLVTSNAKHGGGKTIPHLNFSIPCAVLEPIFKFSTDMQDFSLLQDLDKPDEHLSSAWALMPPLSPKARPSLPISINKDGKGSRFSKFMEERRDLLNESNQLGKTRRVPSEFPPSKL